MDKINLKNNLKVLLKKQEIQEKEYFIPYHWTIDKSSKIGRIYFGYIKNCINLIKNLDKNIKILDAGCGDGRFLKELRDNNFNQVYGIDYSERAINFAKILTSHTNLKVCDIKNLPYNDNFFDVIFLIEVIEHIDPDEVNKIIKELDRVLKNSGKIIITVPSKNVSVQKKHFQHFSLSGLRGLLEPYFCIENYFGYNKNNFILDLIDRILNNKCFSLKFIFHWYNKKIWPKFFSLCEVNKGKQIIVSCKKNE